jgi:hypothetical protein
LAPPPLLSNNATKMNLLRPDRNPTSTSLEKQTIETDSHHDWLEISQQLTTFIKGQLYCCQQPIRDGKKWNTQHIVAKIV